MTGARAAAEAGKLACGTVDSWLIYRLTGGKVHVTDVSNASRTLLMDIHLGEWDDELLACFNVPRLMLPEIRSSSEIYGDVTSVKELSGVPIAGVAGDQQAALFGQACFTPGLAKNTYGTGCFLLTSTGTQAVESKNRLLTTVAWQAGGPIEYALEGGVFVGGAVVAWLGDGLGIIKSSADVERLAMSVPDSGGVYFVPAFVGLGAPHWDPYARGTIVGITRGTTAAHIARAAVESIALQVADLADAMRSDVASAGSETDAQQGETRSRSFAPMAGRASTMHCFSTKPISCNFRSCGRRSRKRRRLVPPISRDWRLGVWSRREAIAGHWQVDRRFEPQMSADKAATIRALG